MKLSLNWLREFVDAELPAAELAQRLTDATAEVEGWDAIGAGWDPEKVRVAEVVAVEPHPNADRLRLATVETGRGRLQVVCGAPNIAAGQKVAFATEGARLVDGHTGKPAVLKLRPIRGVESAGMVLSEKELGLSDEHEGILVLPADSPVGKPLVDALGDVVFDISTWANRADLLSVLGLAREVAALLGHPLREPPRYSFESGRPVEDLVSVTVEAPDLCRRFTASVIENVTIGPSPAWMQERLLKHGMRPINNVVDITNYVMLETGQPLHSFDYDLVRGHRIQVRRARPGERLVTLDGVERSLDPEMLLICDGEGPVAVAGVMGGGNSEVHEGTKNILLEVANFRAGAVRRTSTVLKLRSEASLRFEKGIGPETAEYAQRRALHLFAEVTGGTIARGLVDIFPGREPPREIPLPAARIEQVLGISIPEDEVRRILEALGFACRPVTGGFTVQPPYWRPDVAIADDVIEDVARIYGYERLPATTLRGALPEAEPRPLERLRERMKDIGVALGYQEIITYTLTDRESLGRVVAPDDATRLEPQRVVNPVAAQHTYLRTSLRGTSLATYSANRRSLEGPLRLFEVGFEYLPVESDLPHERPVFCAVMGGPREHGRGRTPGGPIGFFDAKGDLEALLGALGIAFTARPATLHGLLPGHTASIHSGEEMVGVMGQVHPETATGFDIAEPVFLVELWVEDLARVLPERPHYTPPPRFPEVRQDIALLVDAEIPAGRVLEIVRGHRQGTVRVGAEVFDDYRGAGIPAGKKSLALGLRYQAADRTLTDAAVAGVQASLLARLQKELGASLRGV
ncbi:MAG: phenylalanine--tRNA ligase subunit beta [Chloroflexi bacterium CFX7]|nr:phenylalanine--tRNA ligase subunit beta [Chloroflexi bacterium CFX7]